MLNFRRQLVFQLPDSQIAIVKDTEALTGRFLQMNTLGIDYNVTHDELQKVYESHEQFKKLSDEQKERIEGKAYLQTLDEGRKGSRTANFGTKRRGKPART